MAPPKGRGKKEVMAEEPEVSEEEVASGKSPVSNGEEAGAEEPKAKGRGRPKKTDKAPPKPSSGRGRGRPKKDEGATSPKATKRKVEEDSDEPAEPKGRGRPKKDTAEKPVPAKKGRKAEQTESVSEESFDDHLEIEKNTNMKKGVKKTSKTEKPAKVQQVSKLAEVTAGTSKSEPRKSTKSELTSRKRTTNESSEKPVKAMQSKMKKIGKVPESIEGNFEATQIDQKKLESKNSFKSAKGKKEMKTDVNDAPNKTEKPSTSKRENKEIENDSVKIENDAESKPAKLSKKNTATVKSKQKRAISETSENEVTEPKAKKPAKINKSATDYTKLNFKLSNDKIFNFKISSWNVAGLRSWLQKGGLEFIEHEKPDILCLQETKCVEDQLPPESKVKGYHPYWLCLPGGHGGVAIYSKIMPQHVQYGIGDEEQDSSGRILTAEYEKFYLVCVYVPNSGRGLVTLDKRMRWNALFHEYLQKLNSKKPVIIAGDMNVSHQEIDLANPKTNKRNAGFTQEERDGMSELLKLGFVDTFRHLYPELTKAYTFWTYMGNARAKNVGWRLDYFIVSEKLVGKVVDNVIRSDVYGSDHCPITLFLNL